MRERSSWKRLWAASASRHSPRASCACDFRRNSSSMCMWPPRLSAATRPRSSACSASCGSFACRWARARAQLKNTIECGADASISDSASSSDACAAARSPSTMWEMARWSSALLISTHFSSSRQVCSVGTISSIARSARGRQVVSGTPSSCSLSAQRPSASDRFERSRSTTASPWKPRDARSPSSKICAASDRRPISLSTMPSVLAMRTCRMGSSAARASTTASPAASSARDGTPRRSAATPSAFSAKACPRTDPLTRKWASASLAAASASSNFSHNANARASGGSAQASRSRSPSSRNRSTAARIVSSADAPRSSATRSSARRSSSNRSCSAIQAPSAEAVIGRPVHPQVANLVHASHPALFSGAVSTHCALADSPSCVPRQCRNRALRVLLAAAPSPMKRAPEGPCGEGFGALSRGRRCPRPWFP